MRKKTSATEMKPAGTRDEADTAPGEGEKSLETRHRNLVYEQQLYHIELDMQNKELIRAQAVIEESRAKYCELFDSAPVGYVTIDEKGIIREANLTIAKKLNLERDFLLGKPFLVHLMAEDRDTYYSHLKRMFREKEPQVCEVRLVTGEGREFAALLESACTGEGVCRTAISDISTYRNAANILDAVNIGIIVLDMTGRVISLSQALEKITGYGREKIQRNKISTLARKFVKKSDRRRVEGQLSQALKERIIDIPPFCLIAKGGREVPVSAGISYVRDAHGKASQVIVALQDITTLVKRDRDLQHSHDFQKDLNSLLRLSLLDISLQVTLERALSIVLSLPWAGAMRKGSIALIEGDPERLVIKAHRELSREHLELCGNIPIGTCLCGKAAQTKKVQFASHVGTSHEIRSKNMEPHGHYCIPIRSFDKVFGVLNIQLDDGHQRDQREVDFLLTAANTLASLIQRKSNERPPAEKTTEAAIANSLMEIYPGALVSLTPEGKITDANGKIESYTGVPRESLIETDFCAYFTQPDKAKNGCEETLKKGAVRNYELEIMHREGRTIPVVMNASVCRNEAGKVIGALAGASDISGKKLSERKLRENNELLVQSEKLAAIGEMALVTSHELSQSLAHIAFIVEVLEAIVKRGRSPAKELLTELTAAKENISRATDIVKGLSELSQADTGEPGPLDIGISIDNSIRILGRQLRESAIELRIDRPSHAVMAVASPNGLSQVIVNLLSHARCSLEECSDSMKRTIDLKVIQAERTVTLLLHDNGMGMPEKHLSRLFDPFSPVRDSRKGTGLGLSLSKKIIERFGGTLKAESREGLGTTMTITLHRAQAPLQPGRYPGRLKAL
ncbi:MAG: PAS domain S-box protein [Candidatus Eremiobacteraeota bacterium]|nr:PAS domain S-box protein [Candidatus Eremiobacteraeota bacterium]